MISRSVDYAIWIIDEAIARNIRRFISLDLGDPGPDFDQRLLVEVTGHQSWMVRAPETHKLSDIGQTYPVRYASLYPFFASFTFIYIRKIEDIFICVERCGLILQAIFFFYTPFAINYPEREQFILVVKCKYVQ